jgi:hypothetical protein
MTNGQRLGNRDRPELPAAREALSIHPAWLAFIRFCAELRNGEIDRLAIQDGLPVLAETTKKKVKFL